MRAVTINGNDFSNSGFDPIYLEALWGASKAVGTALASSTTETNILPTQANTCFGGGTTGVGYGLSLPAGLLNTLGCYFRLEAEGTIGNTGTPNLTLAVALTDTAASPATVTLATSSAVALATITGTRAWTLAAVFSVVATGATGTLRGQGRFNYDTAAPAGGFGLVSTAAANVDLSLSQVIKLNATWSASSASNTIQVTSARVYVGLTNG